MWIFIMFVAHINLFVTVSIGGLIMEVGMFNSCTQWALDVERGFGLWIPRGINFKIYEKYCFAPNKHKN